jgi:transposase
LLRRKIRQLPTGYVKLFEDETDVLLFPPLSAGWYQRGQSADVAIIGENAKRTIFGAINIETGDRIFLSRGRACASDFQAFLRLIRSEYGKQNVAMLLDNASRHTACESKELARKLDIQLLWLPSRSANINPMDRLWRWMKQRVSANRQHTEIDHHAELFITHLASLSAEATLRKAGLCSKNFWLFR